jgi:hypothetical protein
MFDQNFTGVTAKTVRGGSHLVGHALAFGLMVAARRYIAPPAPDTAPREAAPTQEGSRSVKRPDGTANLTLCQMITKVICNLPLCSANEAPNSACRRGDLVGFFLLDHLTLSQS